LQFQLPVLAALSALLVAAIRILLLLLTGLLSALLRITLLLLARFAVRVILMLRVWGLVRIGHYYCLRCASPVTPMRNQVKRSWGSGVPRQRNDFSEYVLGTRDRNSRRDLGVHATYSQTSARECTMRYGLLWLLGVPLPILLLIFLFGGLH
jgi:hypothetical protein